MKKIVRLTESKLVELIRGIVSEQQVNKTPPNAGSISWDLWQKKYNALIAANTNRNNYYTSIAKGGKKDPRLEASLNARQNALEAEFRRLVPPPIPKVTTTKFMPPEIKHDEEVTKPEPAFEPEVEPIYTEPEPEIEEPVAPPQLQESIKRTLRMFNRIK
jgi:hypothetical protein